ncbi:MAG: hypothetical protein H6658_20990 [Ardenticatenaceae bacterium]|nr:hypothetical protein [Ardenticatenaceae bacterium]MCB8946229.1 hypothetical protein [Ardenticatenaceae bacterium]
MFVFGTLAVLLGAIGLFMPDFLLALLGFETVNSATRAAHDYTIGFLLASSMASFNMGMYYVFASLSNMKRFYWWTVPFRGVTFIVFTTAVITRIVPVKFIGIALWELLGALATGAALMRESKLGDSADQENLTQRRKEAKN